MEIPELVGLGQVSNEESQRDGTAMLDAFACALEVRPPHISPCLVLTGYSMSQMFDLLDATPSPNSTHILRNSIPI